ncbi:MAG: Gfo/Idh/MocA family oxidoreductase [Pirellulales bacterium]|nr:Gfo/Idh/MocA family oxidoreductase [Pirellulales bacterium]MBL7193082.1 Gfo/Idh/MocA family oxidoreductase [Pirellulales bacterium]
MNALSSCGWTQLGRLAGGVLMAATISVAAADEPIRVGIIGLDTSHAPAFMKLFNNAEAADHVPGCRVVAAYPQGSRDIASSVSRVPEYTKVIQEAGVEIVGSIDELLTKVDAVLLESNDGRVHLEQAAPVLAAGRRVFIDKPLAGSLADAIAIFKLAEHHGTPVFTASGLRFGEATQAVRHGSLGKVLGASTYSPCSLEATHMDLAWYGIHGCEALFTLMGTGCQQVTRAHSDDFELVTGVWEGGRIGSFRGIRAGKAGYGGTAFGEKGIAEAGGFDGYRPLVVAIADFFATGEPPVEPAETIELFAFMEAADESVRRGGSPVTIAEVMEKAQEEALRRVAAMLPR